MVGVTLDMDDLRLLTLLQIALRIHDDAACHGAVRAGVAGLGGVGEFKWPDRFRISRLYPIKAESGQRRTREARTRHSEELATRELHIHGDLLSLDFTPNRELANQRSKYLT